MAYKMVSMAMGLTAVLLCGRAPAKRGREKKGSK
jgi:hypothetical protein